MKAIVDAKSFASALSWAVKGGNLKDDRDALELYIGDDGEAYVAHSSSNAFMKAKFDIHTVEFDEDKEDKDVKVAASARYLKGLIGILSSTEKVTLSRKPDSKSGAIVVSAKNMGRLTIPVFMDAKLRTQPKWKEFGRVGDQEFFSTLNKLARLCDKGNTVDLTSVVCIEPDVDSKTLRLIATDRYSMGAIRINYEPADDTKELAESLSPGILLPYEAAVSVPPTKGVTDANVILITEKLRGGGIRFGYEFPDGRVFLHSLVSVKYPSIDSMVKSMEDSTDKEMWIDTNATKSSLNRLDQLVWNEDLAYLTLKNGNITVGNLNNSTVFTIAGGQLPNTDDVDDYSDSIKIKRDFIGEVLSVIDSKKTLIKWSKDGNAIVLRPVTDDDKVADATTLITSVAK